MIDTSTTPNTGPPVLGYDWIAVLGYEECPLWDTMESHAKVVIRDLAELPPVPCYPNRLNQVFMNLLVNAIQSSQPVTIVRTIARPIPVAPSAPTVASFPWLPQGSPAPPLSADGSSGSPGAPAAFLLVFGALGLMAWRALSYEPLRLLQAGFGSVLVPPG